MMDFITRIDYRNGTFYGVVSEASKEGRGMFVSDSSSILLAEWRNNIISGPYVYISDGVKSYGCIKDGNVEGFALISLAASPIQSTSNRQSSQLANRFVFGSFRQGKLYGHAILVNNSDNSIQVGHFTNGQLHEIVLQKEIRNREISQNLSKYYPQQPYTLQEAVRSFMKTLEENTVSIGQLEANNAQFIPFLSDLDQKTLFCGFEDTSRPGKSFGFVLRDSEIVAVGEHTNSLLDGIGRLYDGDIIEDGVFRGGQLEGMGVQYSRQTNSHTIGQQNSSQRAAIEKGYGFPIREICEMRKQFHLRSIYFYNDIVLTRLGNQLQTLIGDISFATQRSPQGESPSFSRRDSASKVNSRSKLAARSPLHSKMDKYERQTDLIDHNSPANARNVNEYEPIRDKNRSYFNNDNMIARSGSKDNVNRSSNKQLNNKSNIPQNSGYPASAGPLVNDSNSQKGNKTIYQTLLERQSRNAPSNVSGPSDRSANRSTNRPKDTRQFVRELEQEERQKRQGLNKITQDYNYPKRRL